MTIEIRIDRSACRGAGSCTRRAPRTFALDAERRSRVVDPNGDGADAIRAAADACPWFAIELHESDSGGTRARALR